MVLQRRKQHTVISAVTSGPLASKQTAASSNEQACDQVAGGFDILLIEPKVFGLEDCPEGSAMPHYVKCRR